MNKTEINCTTGEVVEVPMSVAESAQLEADRAAWKEHDERAELADANAEKMQGKLIAAMAQLQAFRNTAGPSAAQLAAIVKVICAVQVWTIRVLLSKLDAAD